jgi:hypothetical protein
MLMKQKSMAHGELWVSNSLALDFVNDL